MRVYTKDMSERKHIVDLGLLVQFSVASMQTEDKYFTEVYMNDDGKIVLELYKSSISEKEPLFTSYYEVVQ